ncbi:MAG: cupin domain-containing protein [Pseudomonadota bacterium]
MRLNADFGQRASAHGAQLSWQASPMKGVERRMLERIGDEVARATTIVRYAPNSKFSPHVHSGGEEFLVLDGVFQDEHGDFPKGSYIRNPPTSRHTPGSHEGCTILVKLWQFDQADRTHVVADTSKLALQTIVGRETVGVMPLFNDGREDVRFEKWPPNTLVELAPKGGLEIFVVEGGFAEGGETFSQHSWLRLPVGADLSATAGPDGCLCWVKEGHLAHLDLSVFED